MKRSAPLRSRSHLRCRPPRDTEFAPVRERQALVLPADPPPRRVITMRFTFNPQPKHDYVRSPALLEACRLLPCQHCGARGPDAGVCAAHSNWHPHHKGGAIKADDNRIAALCWCCHRELDHGSRLSEEERKALWWPAHVSTVALVIRMVRWPALVPLPDTSICPWDLELA
jgi:hypothetical protein